MQANAATPGQSDGRRPRFYYGWWVVLAVALAQFTQSAGIFPVLGVLIKPMTEEFGWSRTTFTAATSVGTLVGGLAGPFLGPYVDRVGGRRVLIIAFAMLGAVSILQAFISQLWQFYAIQLMSRVLVLGVISLSVQIILPKWFVLKRARAIAISSLGSRFGNALTPLYVQFLVSAYSWRVGTIATGIVTIVVSLIPIALFIKRQPEDIGLLPDGMSHEEKARIDAAAQAAGKEVDVESNFSLRQVSRMPAFYFLLTAQLCGTFVNPALNLHMIPYMTDRGLSAAVAVGSTTVLFITGALGSLIFGLLAERFGIKRVILADYLLTGLFFVLLVFVTSPVTAIVWAALMGIMQGGAQTLNQVLFPDYFGRASLGAIRGAITPPTLATNAIGPLIAAMVYDATGSYVMIWVAFGVVRVFSGLMVHFATPPAGSSADQGERRARSGSEA